MAGWLEHDTKCVKSSYLNQVDDGHLSFQENETFATSAKILLARTSLPLQLSNLEEVSCTCSPGHPPAKKFHKSVMWILSGKDPWIPAPANLHFELHQTISGFTQGTLAGLTWFSGNWQGDWGAVKKTHPNTTHVSRISETIRNDFGWNRDRKKTISNFILLNPFFLWPWFFHELFPRVSPSAPLMPSIFSRIFPVVTLKDSFVVESPKLPFEPVRGSQPSDEAVLWCAEILLASLNSIQRILFITWPAGFFVFCDSFLPNNFELESCQANALGLGFLTSKTKNVCKKNINIITQKKI